MKNSITVYSNGTVNLFRSLHLGKGETKVSVSTDPINLDLVVNSLNIFGDFEFKSYPHYLNKNYLNLDLNNFYYGLLANLAGKDVKLSTSTSEDVCGTLLGVQADKEDKLIVLLKKNILNIVPLSEVIDISLDDNSVDFVKSSLNFDKQCKINFSVFSEKESTLYYQYSLKCQPWKMSYRLLRCEDSFSLVGMGVLSNTTEENWDSVIVKFVCGSPLNDSVVINNLNVSCCSTRGTTTVCSSVQESELSDFYIFTYDKPTTVLSNSSVIIPLIAKHNLQAEEILHYQCGDLCRAIRFKNEFEHNLPEGIYTFILDGVDCGSSNNKLIKKNEVVNLNFCKETTIVVKERSKKINKKVKFVGIKDGTLIYNQIICTKSYFDVENIDSPVKLVISYLFSEDHQYKATINKESVENFIDNNQFVFNIEKDSKIEISNVSNIEKSIANVNAGSLLELIKNEKSFFDGVDELKEVLDLLQKYSELLTISCNIESEIQTLMKDQKRLRSIDVENCKLKEAEINVKRIDLSSSKINAEKMFNQINSILEKLNI